MYNYYLLRNYIYSIYMLLISISLLYYSIFFIFYKLYTITTERTVIKFFSIIYITYTINTNIHKHTHNIIYFDNLFNNKDIYMTEL